MSAECEIDSCGVQAIGRCHSCGRTFCASHQGRGGFVAYVDQCGPCRTASVQRQSDQQIADFEHVISRQQAMRDRIRELVATLSAAGIVAEPRWRWVGERKRFLRGREQQFEAAEPAWPVGLHSWSHSLKGEDLPAETVETGATRTGEVVPMEPFRLGYREYRGFGDLAAIVKALEEVVANGSAAGFTRQASAPFNRKLAKQAGEVHRLRSIYPDDHPDVARVIRKYVSMGGDPSRAPGDRH